MMETSKKKNIEKKKTEYTQTCYSGFCSKWDVNIKSQMFLHLTIQLDHQLTPPHIPDS